MTKITETARWENEVYQISRNDEVEGGRSGVANQQAGQLANRTLYLRVMLEGGIDYNEATFFKTAEDPDGTIKGTENTLSGKIFRVAQGMGAEESFIYYLNDDGNPVPVGNYAAKGYIDARLVQGSFSSKLIPLFHDKNGMVPVWLDNGKLETAGLGDNFQDIVKSIPNLWAQRFLAQLEGFSTRFFPLFHDKNGMVPVWLKDGRLDAAGFGPVLKSEVQAIAGSDPDSSHIEGDIYKFIFKRGRIFNGKAESLNIAFTGDSWTEKNTIPQSLINVLGGTFKDPGWISCSTRADGVMAGIKLTVSGFTAYDGDNEKTASAPPYGSGPDGNGYYNNNAVGSLTWTGVTATDLALFYYDGSGGFTVTIDNNAPITINGENTGVAKKYDISGLASTAHTVKVQSLGAGVVSILGMYGKNSGMASGVTVSRMGNGGAIASDYLKWSKWIAPITTHLDIDLLFILLGTNDFRKSKGVSEYRSGIEEIIRQHKAATPGICICLISPAQCSASGEPALSEYDAEMQSIASENQVNFISGYQLFPKTYDNSQGAWEDTLHLSSLGAYVITRKIKDIFFQE